MARSDTTTDAERASAAREGAGEPILEVEGLKRYFETSEGFLDRLLGGGNRVRAVDGVDLTIRGGETLAVVGESGCGKSTLAQTLLNLYPPTDGKMTFKGEDITGLTGRDMRPYRRQMQIIFQDPLASLNPRKTVGAILKAPMEVHDIGDDDADRTERAEALLERVGLKPGHMDRYPHQFSGGQQQRIGLARALTVRPDLLIADEPVSALDVSVQAQILNLISELQEEFGIAILFIAHDLNVVRHISDRVAVMYLGEFVERAPVDELFENPKHPYTRSLLSAVPRIDPRDRGDRVILQGTVPSPIDPPDGCRFHTRCPVVIPPDDWRSDQSSFEDAFTLRNRLLAEEFNPDAVRERLAGAGRPTDDEAVVDRIIERSLPGSIDDLPGDATRSIEEAVDAYVRGEVETAKSVVREAFPSPCEEEPRMADVGQDHVAACHRADDETPYGQRWLE